MTTQLEVALHGRVVGELVEDGREATFRFTRAYWSEIDRPVLGQWFEDGSSDELYRGPGALPSFFANLEPEGGLARWLARKNQLGT
ncbi:MAG: HipA N-terminal domain-containing protein, partial [Myxococcota bacterium]